jgi:hypothetical protein
VTAGGAWAPPGGPVGFGVDSAPLTELALQAVAGALGEVLVVVATPGRFRRHRRPSTVENDPPPLSGAQTSSRTPRSAR